MHAVTLVCGERNEAHVNFSLFWTPFKSGGKICSSTVLDSRQTWFIWGKKVVLQFFSINLESYGQRLKPVSTEFPKLWALCKIYLSQAKKERAPRVTPILLKQTVITIMCNLSGSMFCLPFIFSNPVQYFTLSNEAENSKKNVFKHLCLGLFLKFDFYKYPIVVFICST